MKKTFKVLLEGDEQEVSLDSEGDELRLTADDVETTLTIEHASADELILVIGGRRTIVPYIRKGDSLEFQYDGEVWSAEVVAPGTRSRSKQRDHSMSAPMPGVVLKIFVTAGDVVTKGMPLLILEAMKMEHQIKAPYDGTVRAVNCQTGQLVQPGLDLIDLQPGESQ